VSEHDFLFLLRLPGTGRFGPMLADLTENVLRHLGFTPAAIVEIGEEVRAGLPSGEAAGGDLEVRFQARGGAIEIVVSTRGRQIVRASRRLP
jgi:hypothetical protein